MEGVIAAFILYLNNRGSYFSRMFHLRIVLLSSIGINSNTTGSLVIIFIMAAERGTFLFSSDFHLDNTLSIQAHADPENNNIHISVWRSRENVMQFHIATGMNSHGETRTMIVLDHCSHHEDNDIYCNCLDIFLPRQ